MSTIDEAFFAVELKNFLDIEGRLKSYPAKRRLKIISLFCMASKIEGGRTYSEKEINEVLSKWHTFEDWALLRRELYERGFRARAKRGGLQALILPS